MNGLVVEKLNKVAVSRRSCLMGLGGLVAGMAALSANPSLAYTPNPSKLNLSNVRELSFLNLHTGERAKKVTYFEYGNYLPDAMTELNYVLRDHRNNEIHAMDPKLMDLLHLLHKRLASASEINVISAYRSPESNAKMAAASNGVAKKSMHMEGRAMDVKLADRSLNDIRDAAKMMQLGGVGYYSGQFVHVDTGRVRSW